MVQLDNCSVLAGFFQAWGPKINPQVQGGGGLPQHAVSNRAVYPQKNWILSLTQYNFDLGSQFKKKKKIYLCFLTCRFDLYNLLRFIFFQAWLISVMTNFKYYSCFCSIHLFWGLKIHKTKKKLFTHTVNFELPNARLSKHTFPNLMG